MPAIILHIYIRTPGIRFPGIFHKSSQKKIEKQQRDIKNRSYTIRILYKRHEDMFKLSQSDKKKYLEELCKQIDTPQNISDHLTMKIFDFKSWILSHA